jgi:NADPH:quinone reductase-like Zn-dependent oxidoreductase
LETVRELAESGKVRAPVDREYTLEEIVDAFRYYESGQAAGKIVITINASGT